ncbi:MAG: SH3 domain-containing protein [Bacilli bacterium]|nr:SH3 domain-containing protein [Bacilli bacterium]
MKKRFVFIALLLFLSYMPLVNASYDAIINSSSVRIRSESSTNGSIIATLSKGTNISVVDKTLYLGEGCDTKWLKLTYKEKEAYVCSKYVTYVDNSFSGINVTDWTARVSGNNVAVRKGAGTNYSVIERLSLGVNVTILDTKDNWYKINYYNSSVGWISKDYVVKKEEITAKDEEYEQTLKTEGFPDDYIPYLTYLHQKYPNWVFKAGKTNLNFSSSVASESGICYMQTENDNYRTSSKPAEGKTWFRVNKGVIAFYMDPRNWLTEERIFMFENLSYEDSLEETYPTLVKSIFGTSKLSADEYTIPMFNAGKTNKISPVHIASRIRLEVGADGSGSTSGGEFTWKGKKYSGYYNFFNIGAYEVTIDGVNYSAVTRGLAYAAKLINRDGELWNNIETAITEGSSFLANGYVSKGQGTLYYQKFNVGPNSQFKKYTHQYMTNIQAPATEGNQTYNSYKKSDVLNQTFIFEIPIYNDMPLYTSLPKSGNTNNDLKLLDVSGYELSPSFDQDIIEYEVFVPLATNKITINAEAEASTSTVSGNGEYELKDDETEITIIVTSETQEEKKYSITIKKADIEISINEIVTKAGYTASDNIITKIKNGTTINSMKNSLITAGAVKVTATTGNGTQLKDTDIAATNYKLEISTQDDTKIYILSVKGDTSGDGNITILDLLQVQKHIKGAKKLTGASLLAGDTSGDNDVTILDLLQVQKHIKGAKKL